KYLSRLKLIFGEIVDESSFFKMSSLSPNSIYIRGISNFSRPGNSGSPLYAMLDTSNVDMGNAFDLNQPSWFYFSPLYGTRWFTFSDGRKEAMVYTKPELFHSIFTDSIH